MECRSETPFSEQYRSSSSKGGLVTSPACKSGCTDVVRELMEVPGSRHRTAQQHTGIAVLQAEWMQKTAGRRPRHEGHRMVSCSGNSILGITCFAKNVLVAKEKTQAGSLVSLKAECIWVATSWSTCNRANTCTPLEEGITLRVQEDSPIQNKTLLIFMHCGLLLWSYDLSKGSNPI